jgi:hypothetical protein
MGYISTSSKKFGNPAQPFYNKFYNDDGEIDRDFRLPGYTTVPYDIYDGNNPSVFKYQYFEGTFNGQLNVHLKLVFYESFEVLIFPVDEGQVSPLLILNLTGDSN